MTESLSLTHFLLARITEDEEMARHAWPERYTDRMLAECEAKRRIVAAYPIAYTEVSNYTRSLMKVHQDVPPVLHLLALPYADHPDYDESWRP